MPNQPKKFLIQILITGAPKPTVRSYYEGTLLPDPLPVNVGDQIAWFVQVSLPNGRISPPYELTFSNPAFFGVSSLSVTAGGTSAFLPVLALQDNVSYGLKVTGVGCVFDPEIQSGSNALALALQNPQAKLDSFSITWDTVKNTMSANKISVKVGDKVTFNATTAPGSVSGFTIQFTPNENAWVSPFFQKVATLQATATSPQSIGPYPVNDNADAGAQFPFTASITVNGKPIAFKGPVEIDM